MTEAFAFAPPDGLNPRTSASPSASAAPLPISSHRRVRDCVAKIGDGKAAGSGTPSGGVACGGGWSTRSNNAYPPSSGNVAGCVVDFAAGFGGGGAGGCGAGGGGVAWTRSVPGATGSRAGGRRGVDLSGAAQNGHDVPCGSERNVASGSVRLQRGQGLALMAF